MTTFVTRNTTEADQVINAEVKMAMLCAKNNVAFNFCDDFNKCVAEMFPDSAIARKFSAGKTKATQLIKGAIATELDDELAKTCRFQPFSVMCDESNNRKANKEFVILTRLYNEATLQVVTRFMEMSVCNVGNAENLYEKLSEALRKRGIPGENLIAFNSDNASVMKGRHNSVISRLKQNQPHVQDLSCICHLAQLATGCGIRAAQVPVEDILVGIYTHFDKSAKRCEIYKRFVDFTDSDHLELLGYCSTRWLSLLTCIQRVLNQWDALQAYFNSHEEVERSAKVCDLASHVHDPIVKAYFMYLSALKPLYEFNIVFQSEAVQIHRLEEEICRLIKRILGFLIPARAIMGVPLKEVEYGEGHQLADEELFIGAETKAFMARKELPVSAEKKIFQSVRRFYEAVLQKMFSSFPLDHPLLKDMKVLDPAARLDITPGTVARLGALFPQLSLSEDRLREELIDYQVTDSKHLPQEDKTDRFWGLVGKDVRFSELPRLMKALLCIPHSNASSERVFSMVRNIVTENRMSLDNSTVCALLSCKINHSGPGHKYTPSKRVLKDAKSVTNLDNKSLVNAREPPE
ncbi:uncharacterized protein LOC124877498 [Girardinichthys multiradiatus]|uniref:uncharacterized protein LOC124877498 n=1 Tax=Girardinichthys multiradiatus TaxID=208333 RepID=UPI001FABEEBC|nr:uncharacterized protein LOC124877498 [Girardinichthys multiradiatus]